MKDKEIKKERGFPIKQILFCVLVVVFAAVGFVVFLGIFPLRSATADYNRAVEEYNVVATDYNSMIQTTSVENLDGFISSAEKLDTENTNLFAVIKAFLNGNTAKKTREDIQTLENLSGYFLDEISIMEQITAPSEQWVMERLATVNDILEIQAVSTDNDPNGLLNKENGGYTACIYFTATGIDAAGDDPVSKGTDGGGAVEVYRSLEDAEARCAYLRGFDNTVLYTGSYAIVGTMVVRISYSYTNEAQYEMTDRIAKAFTRLEKEGS